MNCYFELQIGDGGITNLLINSPHGTLWVAPKATHHFLPEEAHKTIDVINVESLHKVRAADYHTVMIHNPMPGDHTQGFDRLRNVCVGKSIHMTSMIMLKRPCLIEVHKLLLVSRNPGKVNQYKWGLVPNFTGRLVPAFARRR